MANYSRAFKSQTEAFNRRVRVWACKSCGAYCKQSKPTICTTCGGKAFHYFASQAEFKRWAELKLQERAGLLDNLRCSVKYPLEVNGQLICSYIADFVYDVDGRRVVEDVKPASTGDEGQHRIFKLKAKLMQAIHNIDIKIVKRG